MNPVYSRAAVEALIDDLLEDAVTFVADPPGWREGSHAYARGLYHAAERLSGCWWPDFDEWSAWLLAGLAELETNTDARLAS